MELKLGKKEESEEEGKVAQWVLVFIQSNNFLNRVIY